MLTYIDPRIADNGGYRKQKIGPGTIDITEKKGRPEHVDRMVGRERERGRRTGPEDMDPRQNIARPGTAKKGFKEKTIGIIQDPYQNHQENKCDFKFFPANYKKQKPKYDQ
jgi:hypothetical protein